MQLKEEILKKLTAYSESLIDSHGHYVQCVIEDDWSTLADEILTFLQSNNAGQPNASKPIVSGAVEFEKQWMMTCIEDALIVADEQDEQWGNADTARLSVQKIRKEIPLKYLKATDR